MKKRIFILLLSALLCASALTGCGGGETADETTSQTAAAETEAETEFRYTADYLPDVTYDGYAYRVIAFEENPAHVDEPSGDIIDDAIYQRNILLEEQYDITFEQTLYLYTDYTKVADFMRNAGRAQSDDTDLAYMSFRDTYNLVLEGFVPTASSLPVIDLSQPWYMQSLNDSLTIDGITLMAYSAMDTNPGGTCIYFNKQLMADYNQGNIYDIIRSGGWTLDAQNKLAEMFYVDTNGDGARDADDIYGFYTRANNDTSINDGYWASVDLRTISKDENGYYVYDVNQEKFVNGLDNLLVLMKGSGSFTNAANDEAIYKKLAESGAAMINARLHKVEDEILRDMEADYGVLPLPKADENQAEYYSLAQDQFLVYAIPLSVAADGLEDIGMFLEAYASESFNVVRPAYYETALTAKYMNDAESAAMLDLVADSMYIDPAILYLSYFNLNVGTLRNILKQGENTIASQIASTQKNMETSVEKLNEAYTAE